MTARKMPARSILDSWKPTVELDKRAKKYVEQGMTWADAYKKAIEEKNASA